MSILLLQIGSNLGLPNNVACKNISVFFPFLSLLETDEDSQLFVKKMDVELVLATSENHVFDAAPPADLAMNHNIGVTSQKSRFKPRLNE